MITIELTKEQVNSVSSALNYELTYRPPEGGEHWDNLEAVIEQLDEQMRFEETEGRGR